MNFDNSTVYRYLCHHCGRSEMLTDHDAERHDWSFKGHAPGYTWQPRYYCGKEECQAALVKLQLLEME